MPEWRRQYGGTYYLRQLYTYAIDGSEQECGTPAASELDTFFYSSKKEMHSLNIIIIVTLLGEILHISKSYGGAFNDDYIVRNEVSGFDGLEGFNIYTPPGNRNEMYSNVASM